MNREDEWRRINAAAVKGFEMRSMAEEKINVLEAGSERNTMNKADKIHLNLRWIQEAEEKIKVLTAEIAVYAIDINAYKKAIRRLEGEGKPE